MSKDKTNAPPPNQDDDDITGQDDNDQALADAIAEATSEGKGGDDDTPSASDADAPPPPEDEVDSTEVETLRGRIAELEEDLLRAQADYQNMARRSLQDVALARDQEVMNVARSMIGVLDHFDRAIAIDVESTPTQGLLDGVMIVRDELMRALQRHGVERLEVKAGDEFDPNRHEALMRQESDDIESNHIVEQLQPGYILNDRTLRAAQVSVAE